jgi:hypothetical protein
MRPDEPLGQCMSKAENEVWSPPAAIAPGAETQGDADSAFDVEARIAVCEELWGPDNLVPGQHSLMQLPPDTGGSTGPRVHCLIGVGLRGLHFDTGSSNHETHIFEGEAPVATFHLASRNVADARARLIVWDGTAALEAGRYTSISTLWALAAVREPSAFAAHLADALRPGGELCLNELWVTDPEVGRRLGGALGLWRRDLVFPKRKKVLEALFGKLVLREVTERASDLKVEIRDALANGQHVRMQMKNLPDEVRRHRVPALARELQRALVLFDALNRGQVAASRHIFQKPAKG